MISCRKAFCHKVASKRQKCEWCFPYERCLSYNFPQLFPQPKLVCGLLEESSFLATRSWNTALKTSPRRVIPDSWLDPILGFSVFLLNYHIFFFEVHVLLDGLPVASITHVKESTGRFSQCFSLRKVHHTWTSSFQPCFIFSRERSPHLNHQFCSLHGSSQHVPCHLHLPVIFTCWHMKFHRSKIWL